MDRDKERMDTYREMAEALQNLYASPESGAKMFAVFQRFELTEDQYRSYAEIVGDCILGFYRIADMPRLFQQKLGVGADESQRIISQLIEFLTPVVKREEEGAAAKKESLQNLASKFENPARSAVPAPETSSAPVSASSAPVTPHTNAELSELTENVEPLRTMEGDMDRIHGYGAYRDIHQEDEGAAPKEEGA